MNLQKLDEIPDFSDQTLEQKIESPSSNENQEYNEFFADEFDIDDRCMAQIGQFTNISDLGDLRRGVTSLLKLSTKN